MFVHKLQLDFIAKLKPADIDELTGIVATRKKQVAISGP
jgi:hypothetical protein